MTRAILIPPVYRTRWLSGFIDVYLNRMWASGPLTCTYPGGCSPSLKEPREAASAESARVLERYDQ